MDTQLRIFKHIDCPAGNKCTAVRCLFRHEGDQDVPVEQQQSGQLVKGDSSSEPSHQEGPDRKRLKTGEDEYNRTTPPLLPPKHPPAATADAVLRIEPTASGPCQPVAKPQTSDSVPVPSSTGQIALSSTIPQRAAITPPPIKRKRQDVAPACASSPAGDKEMPKKNVAKLSQRSPPGSSISRSSPASESAAAAPPVRKAEALNPRHLKSNPARYEVRYRLIKMLHDEYSRLNRELAKLARDDATKKLLLSDQELIWMVLDEEESAAGRENGYSSVLKSRIISCKKFTVDKWREERAEAVRKAEETLSRDEADAMPSSKPVVIDTGLTREQEVVLLKTKLETPIRDLAKFGYIPTVPSEEEIAKAKESEVFAQGWEVCDRCTRRFQVFPGRREEDGVLASGGACTHHPGKAYIPNRQTSDRSIPEKQYRCCGETVGQSVGCTTKDTHVFKVTDPKRLASLWNFAETPPNPNAPKDRAVCFDCEMGYTVKGFELIRLTATSWPGGEELVDVLVRPFGEVLDLNSAYSGVWPEDIVNALPFSLSEDDKPPPPKKGERKRLQMVSSPVVARDLLFSLISPETPLIGHGLENDLNCLRVVHPTLVDTVLLYPHKRGLPVRHGLRMLMQTILNKQIQVEAPEGGGLQGHDSAEDARAAGDLVRWKVKAAWEKMKREGWRAADDRLVPPGKTRVAK